MAVITLVEDDDDLRSMMAASLCLVGHTVLQASDGKAGLELVRVTRPDLVILDWMMPGLTGPEVCRELRTDPTFSDTPVLVVTARALPGDQAECLEAGATGLLRKPFDLATLNRTADSLTTTSPGA